MQANWDYDEDRSEICMANLSETPKGTTYEFKESQQFNDAFQDLSQQNRTGFQNEEIIQSPVQNSFSTGEIGLNQSFCSLKENYSYALARKASNQNQTSSKKLKLKRMIACLKFALQTKNTKYPVSWKGNFGRASRKASKGRNNIFFNDYVCDELEGRNNKRQTKDERNHQQSKHRTPFCKKQKEFKQRCKRGEAPLDLYPTAYRALMENYKCLSSQEINTVRAYQKSLQQDLADQHQIEEFTRYFQRETLSMATIHQIRPFS